jgi:hypothetical protein
MEAVHGDPGLLVAELRTIHELRNSSTMPPSGDVKVWNTTNEFHVQIIPDSSRWLIKQVDIYIGYPVMDKPSDIRRQKSYCYPVKYKKPAAEHHLVLNLAEDLGLKWGVPYEDFRTQTVAVRVRLISNGSRKMQQTAWAINANPEWSLEDQLILAGHTGYQFFYECMHPRNGHFIDAPVSGLSFKTPTHQGKTEDGGLFNYFPGETVDLAIGDITIGQAVAGQKTTPLDLFSGSDSADPRVINMARLLQSLDADDSPESGIRFTPEIEESLAAAMASMPIESLDFSNDDEIDEVINRTALEAATRDVSLAIVSSEEAQGNLDKAISTSMFRKNVSKTPDLASAKSKLDVMDIWFDAKKANGDPAVYEDSNGVEQEGVAYYDEEGALIRVADQAKPLIVIYCDAVEETGAHDVFAAISRDDGNTWKRKNVSRMADRSSFVLENGEAFYGHCKKPVFQVKENQILIAWTSKFSRGGKPRYAIETLATDPEDTYANDDAYYTEDIWGVAGPQRSVDYTDQGYPEVGEVPYSAVWVCRGLIVTDTALTQEPFNNGLYAVGDIVWFKPERLTSARRDANQIFMGGADSAGFAIAWQEDPEGLRPGEAKGPGPGWGGATTNHKTDIWYSFLTAENFATVDDQFVSGGDPEHDNDDFRERPKALVPMSLPVRISDNDTVNTDNMLVELDSDGIPVLDAEGQFIPILNEDSSSDESDGAHRYGYMLANLWNWSGAVYSDRDETIDWVPGDGGALYEFTNQQDATKRVVITDDGRALDGNTGAARPNVFLQSYTKSDGSKSAWAIMAYEETKGLGSGPDEETGTGEGEQDGGGYDPYDLVPDEGKNVIYHSFDFQDPDLVSAGTILNLPETDTDGNTVSVVEPNYDGSTLQPDGSYLPIANPLAGMLITDWKGDSIPAYENARRPRFILQSKTAAFGGFKTDGINYKEPDNSGTVLMVLYKEGEDGAGGPSDIIARRCVVKGSDGIIRKGNPWDPKNFLPHSSTDTRAAVQNLSTVNPLVTWANPDRDENAKRDGIKVCEWEQPEACLWNTTGDNPYEDARAHRGQIRGDSLVMGYSYTPNWAASRNAHDKYDFYIRRSFDGGETWTTDPNSDKVVTHVDYFIDPDGVSGSELNEDGSDASDATKHFMVTNYYSGGEYEPSRNVSLLKNNKSSVIEPRIVAVPGTIKKDGEWTGIAEDKQNRNVFYLAYGTSINLPDEEKAPEDLFLSYTDDWGTTLYEDEWEVNPDSTGNYAGQTVSGWFRLAKGDPEQGEVQIRMTPDGTRFYSSWIEEGEDGSDIMFRRIMPATFTANQTAEQQATIAESAVADVAIVPGDLDGDQDVDMTDFAIFKKAWATESESSAFNEKADYEPDGMIDRNDFRVWSTHYRTYRQTK